MKTKGRIWKYLSDLGVLETGDEAKIATAKKQYYAQYKLNWQRAKRNSNSSINYFLSKSELKIVKKSKGNVQELSTYMKGAALAYITTSFIFPDKASINGIFEKIALLYQNMTFLMDEEIINKNDCKKIITDLELIEKKYLSALHEPITVMNTVLSLAKTNQQFKENLKKLLDFGN